MKFRIETMYLVYFLTLVKTKAFDTFDHDKMLIKLEHYGIRGKLLKLLTNYLKIANN